MPDGSHVGLPVVVHPGVEGDFGLLWSGFLVANPTRRIGGGLLDVTLDDPHVASGSLEPRRQALLPFAIRPVGPIGEELAPPALVQVVGHPLHDAAADAAVGRPAVAPLEGKLGRDHERRIGDDEPEPFPLDRLEKIALLGDDVGDPVQRHGELGERHRPGVAVGGDDGLGVVAGVQGLHAIARPEVESPAHGGPDSPAGQAQRRHADADDEVGRVLTAPLLRVVGDDVVIPLDFVGQEMDAAGDAGGVQRHQTGLRPLGRSQGRQSSGGAGLIDLQTEKKQPDEGLERRAPLGAAAKGQRVAGVEHVLAHDPADCFGRVAGSVQRLPGPGDGGRTPGEQERRCHGHGPGATVVTSSSYPGSSW